MLPNFSELQNLLSDRIYRIIQERIREKSGAFDAPRVTLFEGDSMSVLRPLELLASEAFAYILRAAYFSFSL